MYKSGDVRLFEGKEVTVARTLFQAVGDVAYPVELSDGRVVPEGALQPVPRKHDDVKCCRVSLGPLGLGGHFREHSPVIFVFPQQEHVEALRAGKVEKIPCGDLGSCDICGHPIFLETDETCVTSRTLCTPQPTCVSFQRTPNTFTLNVPSGKLAIADDLRTFFPLQHPPEMPGVNSMAGKAQLSLAYAAVGLAHGYIGNSCPGIYRHVRAGKVSYSVGSRRKAEEVGRICTDLWWYSICDYDVLQRHAAELERSLPDGLCIVDVEPGIYRFNHWNLADPRRPKMQIYTHAKFHRVGPASPVKDFLKDYREYRRSPQEVWSWLVAQHQGLLNPPGAPLDEQSLREISMAMLSRMFMRQDMRVDQISRVPVTPVELPNLRTTAWGLHNLTARSIDVLLEACEWFPELACRFLEVAMTFGPPDRAVSGYRYQETEQQTAVKLYRKLIERGCAEVDPEYARWVQDVRRVAEWLKKEE